uniref:Uncharacterized protein n=1 Tax=Anser brachyrhynchus TaxID=132585 RepID=A0A8B9C5G7_9AVES
MLLGLPSPLQLSSPRPTSCQLCPACAAAGLTPCHPRGFAFCLCWTSGGAQQPLPPAGCSPCSSSAPHNPVSVLAKGVCRHPGFSHLQKGSGLCCLPQPHLQLSPCTPQPYRRAQKFEEPLGAWGQECRVTFSPAWVTWLGSRAQGGEVTKFTPCFPGWLGHPPGSLPGEQTGKQQQLGACGGML